MCWNHNQPLGLLLSNRFKQNLINWNHIQQNKVNIIMSIIQAELILNAHIYPIKVDMGSLTWAGETALPSLQKRWPRRVRKSRLVCDNVRQRGHAGIKGNGRSRQTGRKKQPSQVACVSQDLKFWGSGETLPAGTTPRTLPSIALQERGVEKGSGWWSTMRGRCSATIVGQTNTWTLFQRQPL